MAPFYVKGSTVSKMRSHARKQLEKGDDGEASDLKYNTCNSLDSRRKLSVYKTYI